MNKYECIKLKGREVPHIIVEADTQFHAVQKAVIAFKVKHNWDVSVWLVEKEDGTEVTHSVCELPGS